jgi:type II secretory pathway pseudopilin PulG
MRIIKENKGFTLIETIVYVGLLVMVMTLVSGYFIWILRADARIEAMSRNQDEMERVMHFLEQEIRASKGIYEPTSSSGQLSLYTSKYPDSNEDHVYTDFYLCGTRLCYNINGNSFPVTSDNVNITELAFTTITDGKLPSVRTHIKMEYAPTAGKPGYEAFLSATSTVSSRGY